MKLHPSKRVDFSVAMIADLLRSQPTNLMTAFYEMQSSFLIGVYKKYSSIETANIISCFARRTHLEILRQREKNLDHDISFKNLNI